jgi:hypothetical protein
MPKKQQKDQAAESAHESAEADWWASDEARGSEIAGALCRKRPNAARRFYARRTTTLLRRLEDRLLLLSDVSQLMLIKLAKVPNIFSNTLYLSVV